MNPNLRFPVVLRYAGIVLIADGLLLGVSAAISAGHRDGAFLALAYSTIVSLLCGFFPLVFVPPARRISNQEGLFVVVFSWLLSCLVGMLPYLIWGGEFTLANAWFESVSGFTTTGSSVIANVEGLPRGLLFWRSATHFLGGIGIVVFAISVLPGLGHAAMILYRSEFSSIAHDQFRARARQAMIILLWVYLGLNALETAILMCCGMSLFDAVNHAFATIATGGFSTRNASVAAYESPAIEAVIMFFMVVSGMHFGLLFAAATGHAGRLWSSSTVRYYLATLAAAVGIVTVSVHGAVFGSWAESLRHGAFQLISVATSTGFASADSAAWPAAAQMVMLFMMIQCGCSGSTAGGIKADRMLLVFKAIGKQFRKLRYPRVVVSLKMDRAAVEQETVETVLVFVTLYLCVLFLSTFALAAMGVDLLSAFSGVVASMGNVGPGFGSVGSMANYNHLPEAAKWILSFTMLCGRLEIFGFLMLFTTRSWK